MAAQILCNAKKKVCILEARDRIGGRVHTVTEKGFSKSIEAGAEFIHGKLPLTFKLLKEAGIKYYKTGASRAKPTRRCMKRSGAVLLLR